MGNFENCGAAFRDGHRKALELTMDGKKRSDIAPGARVQVVQKQDQCSGKLTEGTVQDILTRSATHPHGIKVRLIGGVIGRVKMIIGQP
jgi:uncharacterized repeat protein (TIGR03833 family)